MGYYKNIDIDRHEKCIWLQAKKHPIPEVAQKATSNEKIFKHCKKQGMSEEAANDFLQMIDE